MTNHSTIYSAWLVRHEHPAFGEKELSSEHMFTITQKVLKELEGVTGTDEVRRNLNTELFHEKILDSFGTVELIFTLSEELGFDLSPGRVDRQSWSTPRKIIADMKRRFQP